MLSTEVLDRLDDENRTRPELMLRRVILQHDLGTWRFRITEDDRLVVWPPQHVQTTPAPSLQRRIEVSLRVEHEAESHRLLHTRPAGMALCR